MRGAIASMFDRREMSMRLCAKAIPASDALARNSR